MVAETELTLPDGTQVPVVVLGIQDATNIGVFFRAVDDWRTLVEACPGLKYSLENSIEKALQDGGLKDSEQL